MEFIVAEENLKEFERCLNIIFASIGESTSRAVEQNNGSWKYEIDETCIEEKIRDEQIRKLNSLILEVH